MQLVAAAAADVERPLHGVWARFGKAYQPLGRFLEVRIRTAFVNWSLSCECEACDPALLPVIVLAQVCDVRKLLLPL
jgi:hypothetical protein